jgi:hypothetical protein
MPTVSKKQEKFMQAVAHNPAFAKKVGVPVKVGKEFTKSGGGEMKESKAMVKKEIGFMKKKGAPKSMIKHEMKEAGMKNGGKVKKMALGGAAMGAGFMSKAGVNSPRSVPANSNVQKVNTSAPRGAVMPERLTQQQMQQRERARITSNLSPAKQSQGLLAGASKPPAYAKGPSAKPASPKVGMMKSGGLAAGHKQADGVAKKGKTKAMQVKMAGGGKTKKYC